MGFEFFFFAGGLTGYFIRWALEHATRARCTRVRYGSQCRRRVDHPGPHKAWIDYSASPTGIGHTEHWHDETELN